MVSTVKCVTHVSSLLMILLRHWLNSSWYRCSKINASPMRLVWCSCVRFSGNHLEHNFRKNRHFVTISCSTDRDIGGKWLLSLITVKQRFCRMQCCTCFPRPLPISDGWPQHCLSWTFWQGSEKSRHQQWTLFLLITAFFYAKHTCDDGFQSAIPSVHFYYGPHHKLKKKKMTVDYFMFLIALI